MTGIATATVATAVVAVVLCADFSSFYVLFAMYIYKFSGDVIPN